MSSNKESLFNQAREHFAELGTTQAIPSLTAENFAESKDSYHSCNVVGWHLRQFLYTFAAPEPFSADEVRTFYAGAQSGLAQAFGLEAPEFADEAISKVKFNPSLCEYIQPTIFIPADVEPAAPEMDRLEFIFHFSRHKYRWAGLYLDYYELFPGEHDDLQEGFARAKESLDELKEKIAEIDSWESDENNPIHRPAEAQEEFFESIAESLPEHIQGPFDEADKRAALKGATHGLGEGLLWSQKWFKHLAGLLGQNGSPSILDEIDAHASIDPAAAKQWEDTLILYSQSRVAAADTGDEIIADPSLANIRAELGDSGFTIPESWDPLHWQAD